MTGKRRDPGLALCHDCSRRPVDLDTNAPVEGGLRLATRILKNNEIAGVVYSEEDPRINAQFKYKTGIKSDNVVRAAENCTPVTGVMSSTLESFDSRLNRASSEDGNICKMAELLIETSMLPEDLLYRTTSIEKAG